MNSTEVGLCRTWRSQKTKNKVSNNIGVLDVHQKMATNTGLFRHRKASQTEFSKSFRRSTNFTRNYSGTKLCKSFICHLSLVCGVASIASNPAQANERLTREQFLTVSENCAGSVAPDIMASIVSVESRFHPFAIGVGGANARSIFPSTIAEAIAVANQLVANGERFDAGIAQINIENFDWLELTIPQAFDVCMNLTAAEKVLRDGYDRARAAGEDPDDALRITLSTYNTGHSTRGVRNGYVGRVMQGAEARVAVSTRDTPTPAPETEPQTPDWDVFGSSDTSSAIVFTQ